MNKVVGSLIGAVASTRVQGWGDEPCEPTVRLLPGWSELVASYSRMESAWGWANGGQPILVCYIRKYVIILGGIFPLTSPTKILGDVSPASPAGLTPVHRGENSPSLWKFQDPPWSGLGGHVPTRGPCATGSYSTNCNHRTCFPFIQIMQYTWKLRRSLRVTSNDAVR